MGKDKREDWKCLGMVNGILIKNGIVIVYFDVLIKIMFNF